MNDITSRCEKRNDILNLKKHRELMKSDPVNHPAHYTQGPMEVIDAIEGLGYGPQSHAGNIVKYVARYRFKNGIEDLKKAAWYLDRLIKLEEKNGKMNDKAGTE